MKTRSRDTGSVSGLPPPPAPTARDANPWTFSSEKTRPSAAPETGFQWRGRRPGVATSSSSAPISPAKPTSPRIAARKATGMGPRRRPLFSLVIPAAIALAAILGAVRALESGDYRAAVGPLIATAFVAFVLIRLMRRRS